MPIAVVLLLSVAAVGMAHPPSRLPASWSAGSSSLWWLFAWVAVGWVAAAAMVLARSSARPVFRAALRRALLLQFALLLAAAALLARVGLTGLSARTPQGAGPGLLGTLSDGLPELPLPGRSAVVAVLLVAAAGVVMVAVWVVWGLRDRFFRPRGVRLRDPRYGRGRSVPAERESVLGAVRRARRALGTDEDVRRSVIAAYAAVEAVVGARADRRGRSQTPAEFLRAALAAGVLHAEAATSTLLDLFHEARFSHLPMTDEHRTRALDCLTVLQHDLTA